MSRRAKGQQRSWIAMGLDRPCPFRGQALYSSEDRFTRLELLHRIWTSSRNFAALLDAVTITTEHGVIVDWVGLASAQVLRDPSERLAWGKQYKKDMLDIVRAQRYEEWRDAGRLGVVPGGVSSVCSRRAEGHTS